MDQGRAAGAALHPYATHARDPSAATPRPRPLACDYPPATETRRAPPRGRRLADASRGLARRVACLQA
eukprot:CAMPEP_0185503992 /NCGR_PEP_ID=MMETSP1366-20130426/33192_1 /TAXON_ID=38817 /ORGANISM="Gephyrocapsa oceanica, Strain RCC1303" /LENGTH=67 /DNA_ID=CAMNT_0028113901 /DNA_START=1 /DNA_END=204 /DNA_ORIENTATION=+